MDALDRVLINAWQDDFPICERPFLALAESLGTSEADLVERVRRLLEDGFLTRFGPLYQAEKLGGSLILAALEVPEHDFERVRDLVNALPEVAHNYRRDHRLNMWFVVAAETPALAQETLERIARESGLRVYAMPKIREYFVGLRLPV